MGLPTHASQAKKVHSDKLVSITHEASERDKQHKDALLNLEQSLKRQISELHSRLEGLLVFDEQRNNILRELEDLRAENTELKEQMGRQVD